MVNRILNNKEKNLLKILLLLLGLTISKLFIIDPINFKIVQLQNEKQNIANTNNMEKILINNKYSIEEDIILKIEKGLRALVNIDYMDKKMAYDENNNDVINLEIKVNGNIEQVFKIQQIISDLKLDKNICYFQINKIENSNDFNEGSGENQEIVECIIEINVG